MRQEIYQLDKRLPFDLLLESFVAEFLLAKEVIREVEQIVVELNGSVHDQVSKEINGLQEFYFPFEDHRVIKISVRREGIFERMPKGLFFQSDNRNYEIQEVEEILEAALLFFLPFEQALYHPRFAIVQWESVFFKTETSLAARILKTNEKRVLLDPRQLSLITYLIPNLDRIRGDLSRVSLCFSNILETAVTISPVPPKKVPVRTDLGPPLGESTLGESFTLGSEFYDGLPTLEIQICDLEAIQLGNYFNEGRKERTIKEILIPIFLPGDYYYLITLIPKRTEKDFVLSKQNWTSVLGYNTWI